MAGRKSRVAAKRRNPLVRATRRMGHKIVPSKKVYTRKGRSAETLNRPFAISAVLARTVAPPVRDIRLQARLKAGG